MRDLVKELFYFVVNIPALYLLMVFYQGGLRFTWSEDSGEEIISFSNHDNYYFVAVVVVWMVVLTCGYWMKRNGTPQKIHERRTSPDETLQ